MPNSSHTDHDHQSLLAVLDTVGADQSRWSQADRARFATAIGNDPRARRAVEEAGALDRLLDQAPRIDASRETQLVNRIVAVARASTSETMVDLRSRASRDPSVSRSAPAFPTVTSLLWRPAGALLAASLVLGVLVGSQGTLAPALTSMAETLGLADETSEMAWASDSLAGGEDVL
jgi:hypothetical protein